LQLGPASLRSSGASTPKDFCSADRIERFPVIDGSASRNCSMLASGDGGKQVGRLIGEIGERRGHDV